LTEEEEKDENEEKEKRYKVNTFDLLLRLPPFVRLYQLMEPRSCPVYGVGKI
jgi:hypothetical protein